jgi:hypothetical protein
MFSVFITFQKISGEVGHEKQKHKKRMAQLVKQ